MIENPFKFRIPRPTNKESEKDLSTFNSMINGISNDVLIDESDSNYFLYFVTVKNESEKIKSLELISKKPYLGSFL